MFVHTLEIENLRSFSHEKLEFSRNINILTGANNSGKSTIIKALYKLQDDNSLAKEDIRIGQVAFDILTRLEDVTDTDRIAFENSGNTVTIYSKNLYIRHLNAGTSTNEIIESSSLIIDALDSLQYLGLHPQPFKGFPKTETQNNFIYPFFAKRKTSHFYNQGGKEHTYNVMDSFYNLPAKVLKASQSVNKKLFEKYCEDILGFTISIIPGDNNENKLGIYAGHNTTIPIEAMGEGVANILGLITILLTEDRKLFLIEELENDIHPQALKKLLNLIIDKSEKNQFIISTHSNIVLKYLGSLTTTKIFFTETISFEGGVPTGTIKEVENSSHDRLRILEQLGYDLFDYNLYKGYLLLEESSAEKIIKDFLIPNFVPQLINQLRTIAAAGADDLEPKFNDFHRLFLYVHITEVYKNKAWVIADGDAVGKKYIQRLQTKFKTWSSNHFQNFDKENFEQYYPERFKIDVNTIMKMPHGKSKQELKTKLLKTVVEWIEQNKEQAITEFSISARDVIDRLIHIRNELI